MTGRSGEKLPGFCLNGIRPHALIRSLRFQTNPIFSYTKTNTISDTDKNSTTICKEAGNSVQYKPDADSSRINVNAEDSLKVEADDGTKRWVVIGKKIIVVVDSSNEAKGALQWILSHTVQSQDTIILLYAIGETPGKDMAPSPRIQKLVSYMKSLCQRKKPKVQVQIVIVEGKEKVGEEARKREVSLLVLGHKKQSTTWRLLLIWAGHRLPASSTAEYCIQNASCMAVALRKKSKELGGYLITTKRHRDFWLLA